MDECFSVHKYSFDAFINILSESSKATTEEIEHKQHADYFKEYFSSIQAKSILVERDYVDRDYLEDYAEYYVRCFKDYPRRCTRLHIFCEEFTESDFIGCLLGQSQDFTDTLLQKSYLGFIVVKPLPKTIIGRTCLKTYPYEGRRYFPATRYYTVNLFGIELRVEQTLAFQEQDSVVAACATSALWSMFQSTGLIFQHPIPSPSTITNNATEILSKDYRALPSKGLSTIEMAHAIKRVGLEPHAVNTQKHYHLRANAYAYMRAQIPVMFGFNLIDVSSSEPVFIGKHAVAVTGYSLGNLKPEPLAETEFLLTSEKIDKIYVHDDQVGPYSRMVFDGQFIDIEGDRWPSLKTSWRGADGKPEGVRAISEVLLIPVYHKIRIPFTVIHDIIYRFDLYMRNFVSQISVTVADVLGAAEWDIYLSSVNQLKAELRQAQKFDKPKYRDLFLRGLPKFIWRAKLLAGDSELCEFIFDATDIEQGSCFLMGVEYDNNVLGTVRNIDLHTLGSSLPFYAEIKPLLDWIES